MIELGRIEELENFIIYRKVKDIGRGGREGNVSGWGFSFEMKKLEEIVGSELVVEGENRIEVSKEGEMLLGKGEKMVWELKECLSEMKKLGGEEVCLCVGGLMCLGDVFMNEELIYFKKQKSNIKINVYNLEGKELINELEGDKLDIV